MLYRYRVIGLLVSREALERSCYKTFRSQTLIISEHLHETHNTLHHINSLAESIGIVLPSPAFNFRTRWICLAHMRLMLMTAARNDKSRQSSQLGRQDQLVCVFLALSMNMGCLIQKISASCFNPFLLQLQPYSRTLRQASSRHFHQLDLLPRSLSCSEFLWIPQPLQTATKT